MNVNKESSYPITYEDYFLHGSTYIRTEEFLYHCLTNDQARFLGYLIAVRQRAFRNKGAKNGWFKISNRECATVLNTSIKTIKKRKAELRDLGFLLMDQQSPRIVFYKLNDEKLNSEMVKHKRDKARWTILLYFFRNLALKNSFLKSKFYVPFLDPYELFLGHPTGTLYIIIILYTIIYDSNILSEYINFVTSNKIVLSCLRESDREPYGVLMKEISLKRYGKEFNPDLTEYLPEELFNNLIHTFSNDNINYLSEFFKEIDYSLICSKLNLDSTKLSSTKIDLTEFFLNHRQHDLMSFKSFYTYYLTTDSYENNDIHRSKLFDLNSKPDIEGATSTRTDQNGTRIKTKTLAKYYDVIQYWSNKNVLTNHSLPELNEDESTTHVSKTVKKIISMLELITSGEFHKKFTIEELSNYKFHLPEITVNDIYNLIDDYVTYFMSDSHMIVGENKDYFPKSMAEWIYGNYGVVKGKSFFFKTYLKQWVPKTSSLARFTSRYDDEVFNCYQLLSQDTRQKSNAYAKMQETLYNTYCKWVDISKHYSLVFDYKDKKNILSVFTKFMSEYRYFLQHHTSSQMQYYPGHFAATGKYFDKFLAYIETEFKMDLLCAEDQEKFDEEIYKRYRWYLHNSPKKESDFVGETYLTKDEILSILNGKYRDTLIESKYEKDSFGGFIEKSRR